MSESAHQQSLNQQIYYLFFDATGGHDQSPSTVFYKVSDEAIAQGLCELFKEVFGQENSVAAFHNVAAKSLSVAKRVLLDEASDTLWRYDDPDSGVYDPPPPKDLMTRAQFAFRARDWEELLRQLAATEKKHVGQETGEKGDVPPSSDEKTPNMAHEDFLNCGLHLLMLFTQAYYKLLESAVGLPCHAADTELNQCYLWTIKNLRILLNKHPDLADFGVKFEPYLPNLLPTTTCDVDWADMAAPEADRLLGAVQEYVMDKGIRDPAEGSPAQVYIESYRPGVDNAIKVAMAYRKRMKKQFARLLKPAAKRAVKKKPATDATGATAEKRVYFMVNNRFKIEDDFSKVTALQSKTPVWRLQPFARMVIKVLLLDCNRSGLTSDEIYDRAKAAFEAEHPESREREKCYAMMPARASLIQFLRVQRKGRKRPHPLYDELSISGQKPAVYSFDGKVIQREEE